jgi:ABC-type nitrate/sulfonate/bicarbonate transport system substrate-binding protein
MITNKKEYALFIKATRKGYLYAVKNKSKAVSILKEYLTAYDKANIDLHASMDITAPHFGNDNECGSMKPERINVFLKWLVEHNLENKKIIGQNLFTNDLLKE